MQPKVGQEPGKTHFLICLALRMQPAQVKADTACCLRKAAAAPPSSFLHLTCSGEGGRGLLGERLVLVLCNMRFHFFIL